MRWPFSLLFRGDRDAPAAADGPAGGAVAPAGGSTRVPAPSLRPAAWKGLAPVQRTVADAPLTAPAGPFARGLASRRAPDPILRPLAHDVTADGPAGLVSGIASPLVVPATAAAVHPEAAVLPVGGGAAHRRSRTVSVARSPLAGGSPAGSGDDGGEASVLPAPLIRELPVAGTSAPALAATRVAAPTAPEPARPHARPTAQRAMAGTAEPAEMGPGGPTATAAAGAGPGGSASGGAPAAPGALPAGPAEGDAPAVQRRTLGESRRLGLGAPLARRPEPRAAQIAPALPLARSTGPGAAPGRVASAAPAPLPVLRLATAPPTAPPTAPAAASAPTATDAPLSAGEGPGGEAGTAAGTGEGAGTTPGATPTRPLLGDPARRAAPPAGDETGAEDAAGRAADTGPMPLVARLATDAPASLPDSVEPGRPGPGGSGPVVQASLPAAGPPAATAPLVAARPTADPRPSLRSSVAPGTSPRLAVVVARRAVDPAVAPAATRSGAVSDRGAAHAPETGPGRSAADVALGPARSPASLQRSTADAGPAGSPRAAATPDRVDGLAGPSAVAPLAGAPPSTLPWRGGAVPATPGAPAGPAGRSERLDLALPVVSRLAAADVVSDAPPPGTALGWTPSSGFGPVPAAVGPVVQRVVEVGEMTAQVEPGSSAGGAGPAASAGAGGGPDYEEIAEHVYDRIRGRIALELLLDRERMGLLIDG